jgi:hypothetical protein
MLYLLLEAGGGLGSDEMMTPLIHERVLYPSHRPPLTGRVSYTTRSARPLRCAPLAVENRREEL